MRVRNLFLLKMGKYSDYNWLNFRRFIRVVSLKLLYFSVVPIFVFYFSVSICFPCLSLCLSFAFFFSSAPYFYFSPLFLHCFCRFHFPLFRAPPPAHTMSKTHISPPFTLTNKKHTRHTKIPIFHFCRLSISCLCPGVLIFLPRLPPYAKNISFPSVPSLPLSILPSLLVVSYKFCVF